MLLLLQRCWNKGASYHPSTVALHSARTAAAVLEAATKTALGLVADCCMLQLAVVVQRPGGAHCRTFEKKPALWQQSQ